MSKTTRKKANLWRGLIAIGVIVIAVMVIGIIIYQQQDEVIVGEAEATEYRVSGKLPGRIEEYYFEEGDQVKKGDTLVFINSPEIQAKLAQARAAKKAASAQNAKAHAGARKEQIAGALALYQKAQVGVDITKKSFDRVQTLYEKNVIPQQKRDEVEAQYKAALATADAAKTQYDMAVNGAQREDIMAAQALVERAEGAVSEVSSYLDEINLTSPVDGEVTERFPKVGELVGSGSPIMSIVDLKDMWFTFNVREDKLKDMSVGTEITIQIPAL
ncbi:MAG: efflux RND transporter periplasmic adaptor subunit, partial [Bacteroidales bacterium]|nr:efflux RND transporter periplasmic adaptor subunit [Bacteroidales bacterium]